MTAVIRRRAIVSGVVQGVGFRWSVREAAMRLGIAGFARNRADGTVEVEAEGEPGRVDEFVGWLHTGPPGAQVAGVETSEVETTGAPGFDVG